jgi:hypothetical protein
MKNLLTCSQCGKASIEAPEGASAKTKYVCRQCSKRKKKSERNKPESLLRDRQDFECWVSDKDLRNSSIFNWSITRAVLAFIKSPDTDVGADKQELVIYILAKLGRSHDEISIREDIPRWEVQTILERIERREAKALEAEIHAENAIQGSNLRKRYAMAGYGIEFDPIVKEARKGLISQINLYHAVIGWFKTHRNIPAGVSVEQSRILLTWASRYSHTKLDTGENMFDRDLRWELHAISRKENKERSVEVRTDQSLKRADKIKADNKTDYETERWLKGVEIEEKVP